ncbi:MAG: acetylxylan esterase, partial [Chloroflexi bacterium]|nr:acetylxylan esterase [Chloroflexota bacterium]
MAHFDLPLDDLQTYQPERSETADFDAFWADTLAASRAKSAPPDLASYASPLRTVDVSDV